MQQGALRRGVPDPLDALRDALGLCRLLYATEQIRGASSERLAAIAEAGRRLATAARFAALEPGSLGHRAAPGHAREGMRLLAEVGWPEEVAALTETARRRVG